MKGIAVEVSPNHSKGGRGVVWGGDPCGRPRGGCRNCIH
jgi:hypothetical protein